jgi:hypothetical protein
MTVGRTKSRAGVECYVYMDPVSASYPEDYSGRNIRFRSFCKDKGIVDLTLACLTPASYAADST